MNNQSLSIIIPSIGRLSLKHTLQSLCHQTSEVDEVIVVHDPEDKSTPIIASGMPGNVKCIEDNTIGPRRWGYKARTLGIRQATRSWIHIIGDDDVYLPNALARMRARLRGNPIMFRMRRGVGFGDILWKTKTFACGQVAGEMFVFPNIPSKFGMFTDRYEGDWDFALGVVNKFDGNLEWSEEELCVWRAPKQPVLKAFYHVFLTNQWSDIVHEQIAVLSKSGLYGVLDEIIVSALGPKGEIAELGRILSKFPKFRPGFLNTNPVWCEHAALRCLIRELSKSDFFALYFHTKGVTSPANPLARQWRFCLNQLVLNRWRECVESLFSGFDTAGGRLLERNPGNWPRHYSGNFWWATSTYLRSLRSPDVRDRHDAENWVLSGDAKAFNLGWLE